MKIQRLTQFFQDLSPDFCGHFYYPELDWIAQPLSSSETIIAGFKDTNVYIAFDRSSGKEVERKTFFPMDLSSGKEVEQEPFHDCAYDVTVGGNVLATLAQVNDEPPHLCLADLRNNQELECVPVKDYLISAYDSGCVGISSEARYVALGVKEKCIVWQWDGIKLSEFYEFDCGSDVCDDDDYHDGFASIINIVHEALGKNGDKKKAFREITGIVEKISSKSTDIGEEGLANIERIIFDRKSELIFISECSGTFVFSLSEKKRIQFIDGEIKAFSADSGLILSRRRNSSFHIWDFKTSQIYTSPDIFLSGIPVFSQFIKNDSLLVLCTKNGWINIWSVESIIKSMTTGETFECCASFQLEEKFASTAVMSECENYIFVATDRGIVTLQVVQD